MLNGNKLLEILDSYLEEKKISRRQFCALINIPTSTVASWKSKNILPPLETIVKLAKFMNVSLDWLVYGEKAEDADNSLNNPCSRKSILYRIENTLRGKYTDYDYDLESLHEKYLSNIVTYEVLLNWANGQAYLPEDVLPKIAEKLNVSLQWLLTQEGYHQEDFDAFLYGLAKSYPGILKGYDCMEPEDQKFIDNYIATKLENSKLKREAELNKQKM